MALNRVQTSAKAAAVAKLYRQNLMVLAMDFYEIRWKGGPWTTFPPNFAKIHWVVFT